MIISAISIEAAVAAFSQARAPGIYKGDYLRELFSRYGDVEDMPPPPDLPKWCFEDEDLSEVDDDGNSVSQESGPSSSGAAPGRRKKEKLKLVSFQQTSNNERVASLESTSKYYQLLYFHYCQTIIEYSILVRVGSD